VIGHLEHILLTLGARYLLPLPNSFYIGFQAEVPNVVTLYYIIRVELGICTDVASILSFEPPLTIHRAISS
jgi:hypothetical protein